MPLRRVAAVLAAGALSLLASAPASALTTCGSTGQPACVETAPPGVELRLTAAENPFGLLPISTTPAATKPLWPRVRGHKPYGFNAVSTGLDGTTLEDEAMLHEQAGASMARIAVDWGMVQYYPSTKEGGQPWAWEHYVDRPYRAYVKRGVRPLLVILKTPRRFTKNAATSRNSNVMGCGTSDACHNPPTAAHLDKLAAFSRDLAKRYPLAAGVEVWNEPNQSNPFWGGEPVNPEHYTAMLRTVHDNVKKVRPTMRVLGGSMAGFLETYVDDTGHQRMAMRTFLSRALRAGAASRMDAVSYHPYLGKYPTWEPTIGEQDRILFARMGAMDDALANAYTDAGAIRADRIVATELGASSTDGFTEERQAAWLRLRFWLWDVDHAYLPLPVDAAFFHKAVEETAPAFGQTHKSGYGFVRVKDATGAFAPKPVFCAFRTEFGGFASCPQSLTTG